MADNEEQEENTARGNEWEVVSLTASAYAAAPGPKDVELKDGNKDKVYEEDEAESSRSLFMSQHFVFPPSQHENLPLEPESSEILDESVEKNVPSEHDVEEGKSGGKEEESWPLKDMNIPDEFPGMHFLDEKEQSVYSTATFSSFHSETGLGGSATYGDSPSIPDVNEASDNSTDSSIDISHSPKSAKDAAYDGSGLPCEAWWKKRAASLYTHAKETNTFWSFFVAAAVMGLVILGHRWQQERWRSVQLKWHSSINEKTGRMVGPISRLKDAFAGGHGRGSYIKGSYSS
ncbi:ATG8-interacting protein 2 [Euphorbia peplus]|nr:ATG8-interacting protein 2 [Euphorbia peplus]